MAAQFVSLSSCFSVSLFSPHFSNSPAFPVSYKAFLSSFPHVTLSSPRSVYMRAQMNSPVVRTVNPARITQRLQSSFCHSELCLQKYRGMQFQGCSVPLRIFKCSWRICKQRFQVLVTGVNSGLQSHLASQWVTGFIHVERHVEKATGQRQTKVRERMTRGKVLYRS